MRVDKILFLPSLAKGLVTVKTLVRSLYPPQMLYGDKMKDSCKIEFCVKEKTTGQVVGKKVIEGEVKRDNRTYFETSISLDNPKAWTPDSPFLYEGEVSVYDQDELVDRYSVNFGMRDFSRKGKFFTLNGDKFYLRGSNITLQRFFEDPDCQALAWDREWVKKLMIDLPKSIDWNAMRICVGIVPDFWYDLCDEYGIVLQNEWLYWQNHGWDEQVRKEYTNWLWRDGRPSKLTLNNYNYYLGENATPAQCRELQAYWLQLETEWLRSERSVGGILAFCHLTNNYGFTGDWFINDIKDLQPSPAFRWFKHCFAPTAVFIDLTDHRYTKHLPALKPGSDLVFNLVGVNDLNKDSSGKVLLKLLDEKGTIISTQEESIVIEPFGKRLQPCLLKLPSKAGGYLLIAEYHEKGGAKPVLSRRYLKVGDAVTSFKDYFEYTLN